MNKEHISRALRNMRTNLKKEKIYYSDIGYMLENEKQYMEFFKSLDEDSDEEINEDSIFVKIGLTYNEYKDNLNRTYDILESGNELSEDERQKIVKQTIAKNLVLLGRIMQESNAINFLIKKHNRKFGRIDESLIVEKQDVEKSFKPEKIKNYKDPELYALSVFWTNKFIKYIDAMEEYYMYIKDTKGVSSSELSLEQKDRLLYMSHQKKKFIERLFHDGIDEQERQEMCKAFKQEYEKTCQQHNFKRTSLKEDYEDLHYFEIIKGQLYVAKNMVTRMLLIDRINDGFSTKAIKDIRTWGMAEDSTDKSKYIVTIELPGYMLPISVHVPKDYVRDMLKSNEIDELELPLYSLEKDFTDENGNFLSATIAVKPELEQRQKIKTASKRKRQNKVLKHIRNQIEDKAQTTTKDTISINVEDR